MFHRTLAENIAYARPEASRADIARAARLGSAHDFMAVLPDGYDTLVGERGVKLSGGECRRVARGGRRPRAVTSHRGAAAAAAAGAARRLARRGAR